jgi:hypothetical protein
VFKFNVTLNPKPYQHLVKLHLHSRFQACLLNELCNPAKLYKKKAPKKKERKRNKWQGPIGLSL